jgi:putative endonuclease
MSKNIETGSEGERLAYDFLVKLGYKILEKNWRSGKAEVDLIAQHNNTLIFVEVKTRSTNFFAQPEASVDAHKQKMLAKAAGDYLEQNNLTGEIRFDVISIILKEPDNEVVHFEDAFFPYDF